MTGLANFEKVKGDTKMKKKGFTLVELLVVIAIIALLMGILMPALNRVRQIAYRMICGTHLKGIGGGMVLYANDNGEAYPIGGLAGSIWSTLGRIPTFDATTQALAFTAGQSTITSSLFLLVKGYDLAPALFVCKGDSGTKEFKLSDTPTTVTDMTSVWDFGSGAGLASPDYPIPGMYNSYAYHDPFKGSATGTAYPVNVTSAPGSPVCSDRNPYLDKNAWGTPPATGYLDRRDGAANVKAPFWDTTIGTGEYKDPDKTGNCAAHQREGQNVLYNDNHVGFEKLPNVGIENDHIWKHWPSATVPTSLIRQIGTNPSSSTYSPAGANGGTDNRPWSEQDAYLVSEKNFTP